MATSFREEHRQAVAFLNELAGARSRLFAVEVGAVRIGDSLPAPLFRLVAQPNDLHAQAAMAAQAASGDTSGLGALYAAFWQRFLEEVAARHPGWTNARVGPSANGMFLRSQFGGSASYGVNFPSRPKRLRCELYLRPADPADAEERFSQLLGHRADIEGRFGGELAWEPLEGRLGSRVATYKPGDVTQTDQHDQYVKWFIESLERLRHALDPYA